MVNFILDVSNRIFVWDRLSMLTNRWFSFLDWCRESISQTCKRCIYKDCLSGELRDRSINEWDWRHGVLVSSAAVTEDCGMGDLNNRHSFSHSSGGQKSEVKVLAGLIPLCRL